MTLFESDSWIFSSLLAVVPSVIICLIALWLVRKMVSVERLHAAGPIVVRHMVSTRSYSGVSERRCAVRWKETCAIGGIGSRNDWASRTYASARTSVLNRLLK